MSLPNGMRVKCIRPGIEYGRLGTIGTFPGYVNQVIYWDTASGGFSKLEETIHCIIEYKGSDAERKEQSLEKEFNCKVCSKPNDMGTTKCWWCGNG